MNRGLEHLLLVVALLEELCRERAGLRVQLQLAALLLNLELFFRWYLRHHPLTEVHRSGAYCPMLPMECPKCSSSALRVPITNNRLTDQVVRRRQCVDCGHKWFTVEMAVPDYAVGWSATHLRKPVLRVPLELNTGHTKSRVEHIEAKDRIELLRDANARRAAKAEARYGM